jgi:hypothetical protein
MADLAPLFSIPAAHRASPPTAAPSTAPSFSLSAARFPRRDFRRPALLFGRRGGSAPFTAALGRSVSLTLTWSARTESGDQSPRLLQNHYTRNLLALHCLRDGAWNGTVRTPTKCNAINCDVHERLGAFHSNASLRSVAMTEEILGLHLLFVNSETLCLTGADLMFARSLLRETSESVRCAAAIAPHNSALENANDLTRA